MLLISAPYANIQIILMIIFYGFVHFSLDSCCVIYWLPWLAVSWCVAFHLGEHHIPAGCQGFMVCFELPFKASLSLSVDGNTGVPWQRLDHYGSSRSLSCWTSVGDGSVLLVCTSIKGCGERDDGSSWEDGTPGRNEAGLENIWDLLKTLVISFYV